MKPKSGQKRLEYLYYEPLFSITLLLQVTANLVRRAEKAGFSAIVLTVDAPYFGRRLADIRNKFKLPPHLKMANFVGLGDAETQ